MPRKHVIAALALLAAGCSSGDIGDNHPTVAAAHAATEAGDYAESRRLWDEIVAEEPAQWALLNRAGVRALLLHNWTGEPEEAVAEAQLAAEDDRLGFAVRPELRTADHLTRYAGVLSPLAGDFAEAVPDAPDGLSGLGREPANPAPLMADPGHMAPHFGSCWGPHGWSTTSSWPTGP